MDCLLKSWRFHILSEVLVSVLHAVTFQKLSSNPEVLLPPPKTETLVLFASMKPLPFKLARREIWRLRKDFKNQPFPKLIELLLYGLLMWCLCVIYERLAAHFHIKDNTIEAEMQLVMWYCKEGERGGKELLHWVRQLLGSEVQGRKD